MSFYSVVNTLSQEANTDIVNWINQNRYELANLGFCGSNFPDVIFFANNPAWNEANQHDLPVGRKVYKKVDNSFFLLQLAAYICGSNLMVATIYILCVLIYYGKHRG